MNINLKTISLEDGKYTIFHHEGNGRLTALRHGELEDIYNLVDYEEQD